MTTQLQLIIIIILIIILIIINSNSFRARIRKFELKLDADSLICSLGHWNDTVHKLSQRRLTANLLAPRESDCSRMSNKVSFEWLPSYIKATPTVLEIYKMAGYFPGRPLYSGYRVVMKIPKV